jgi:hypothetical protein
MIRPIEVLVYELLFYIWDLFWLTKLLEVFELNVRVDFDFSKFFVNLKKVWVLFKLN